MQYFEGLCSVCVCVCVRVRVRVRVRARVYVQLLYIGHDWILKGF